MRNRPRCGTCVYLDPIEGGPDAPFIGVCCREVPADCAPLCKRDSWCGQHQLFVEHMILSDDEDMVIV